jgi:hypothetical protein
MSTTCKYFVSAFSPWTLAPIRNLLLVGKCGIYSMTTYLLLTLFLIVDMSVSWDPELSC